MSITPKRPQKIPNFAEICLRALHESGLGNTIIIGGAFGLMHYYEYRSTFDVDAWWQLDTSSSEKKIVIQTLEKVLTQFGAVRTRRWGDVVSVELLEERKKQFSFQIAQRLALLKEPTLAKWANIPLDSFDDLIASKMSALVNRGAPRDFVDIFTFCERKFVSPERCWQLWVKRQQLNNEDADIDTAKLAIRTHLARIEQHRPLNTITDEDQKVSAVRIRSWYKEVFAHVSKFEGS